MWSQLAVLQHNSCFYEDFFCILFASCNFFDYRLHSFLSITIKSLSFREYFSAYNGDKYDAWRDYITYGSSH